jgi:ketosteroid isomerase-like protein
VSRAGADVDAAVAGVLRAYAAAVLARDVDAFLRLYADEVLVFDTWASWSYDGAAAWRRAVEGWFGSLGDERVQVDFDAVRSWGATGFAVASATGTYAALSPAGERLRSMQNRITWGLRLTADGLRIVHEHTSAPLGDDLKGILRRPVPPA